MDYKPNLVGFLDILGFSSTCLQTESRNEARATDAKERIRKIFALCQTIPREFDRLLVKRRIHSIVISDSILLTLELESENPSIDEIANFTLATGQFQYHLAKNDFFIRGAISVGPLYFNSDEKQAVGPALIRAVELEKTSAKYPRVILDSLVMEKSAYNDALEFRREVNGVYSQDKQHALFEWAHPFDKDKEAKLARDVPFIVDFLRSTKGDQDVVAIAESVARGLRGPIQYYEKYRWLADYVLASHRQRCMGLQNEDPTLEGLLG